MSEAQALTQIQGAPMKKKKKNRERADTDDEYVE
jgi:hypothetical protein